MNLDTEQLARELHKPVQKPKITRQVQSYGRDNIWASDLMDMQWMDKDPAFLNANDGYRFISVWIDIFSRYAWTVPQKTASAPETWNAFEHVMATSGRTPQFLWVDQGGSYTGKAFKDKANAIGIELYHTYGPHKSVFAERFNQTLGRMIWMKFTELQTRKWVPLLPKLTDKYNHRVHRSLSGLSPALASDPGYQAALWDLQYQKRIQTPDMPEKFKVGDFVRVSRAKGAFEKGYHASWTGEVFQIRAVKSGVPPLYYLRDFSGENVLGAWYTEELQKTTQTSDEYLVEKVLKERTKDGKRQLLVKWLGWPEKYNSWIDESDVTKKF